MIRYIAIVLALMSAFFVNALPALAFQEQQVPVTAPQVDKPNGVKGAKQGGVALSGVDNTEGASKKKSGLYIPGLGALPNLHFGLELLYEDKSYQSVDELKDEGMAIKGRLKHKF